MKKSHRKGRREPTTRRMPSDKITLAVISDLHIPSALGLFPNDLKLDDGQTVAPSKTQRFLRECFHDFVNTVKIKAAGGRLYTVVNGDAVEADAKDRSWQVVTKNPKTMLAAAIDVLNPLLSPSDRVFFVRGTEAHGGKANHLEELLADDWKNIVCDENDNKSWWSLYAEFGGVYFEFSHHTTGDAREWTTNSAMVRLAKQTVIKYTERGLVIPRFAIRSHMHRYMDSFDASPICRALTTPGWTTLSAYEYRLGSAGLLSDIGGFIFTIENGVADFESKLYRPLRRLAWREK